MTYRWIKLSSESQSAAKWCARRGYFGIAGDPLPAMLSQTALEEINANQRLFRLAVHTFKLNVLMNR